MPITVRMRKGAIEIRIPLGTMKRAVTRMPALEHFDEASGNFFRPKMPDPFVFAQVLMARLRNGAGEDELTPVQRMIDDVAVEAIEAGAEGVLLPCDPDYGRKVKAG